MFLTAILPQAPFEINPLFYFAFILLIPVGVIINTVIGAKVARRVGVGSTSDYFIGFIAGAIGTVIPIYFIRVYPPLGILLTIPISAGLAWAIAKWARMGAKED